jgi:hypothetical protein
VTGRERMDAAMRPARGVLPDRVPVMCQLSLGHYFLQTSLDPVDIWHDTRAFGEALILLQRRYRFDGILVNLPGRHPEWRRLVRSTGPGADGATIVRWIGGRYTSLPPDDNPHVHVEATGERPVTRLEEVDPAGLFYVEPHDLAGMTWPARWAGSLEPAVPGPSFFPPWHWDTVKDVRSQATEVSVHGEVFSPFTQLMELIGYTDALSAMMTDPGKVHACLARLVEGAIVLACGHLEAGADAVLISSAFAGAGFLSPAHYREFVLPYERAVIAGVRRRFSDRPVYTHTCGAIGDRLELMEETGTNGIDTLDPPPLGTVDLADAKRRLGQRLFVKGNMDPVNTLLLGTPGLCYEDALRRLAVAKPGGGYILSTACSVAPRVEPWKLELLVPLAEQRGCYGA